MPRKIFIPIIFFVIICSVCFVVGAVAFWPSLRPQPPEKNETIFQGITYIRDVRQSPRPMVVHIMIVDIKQKGISFLVTPGDPDADLSLKARTTSQFLEDFNLQLAVNGDGFTPWYDNSIFDYYPHPGDPVEPVGFAASKGTVYSQNTDAEPILYITRTNRAEFNNPPGKIHNAISGNVMLVDKGKGRSLLDESPQPRTAIGLNKNGRYLIIVVVDGRLPGYSEGATLAELSQILIDFGAHSAMNLDGGGSSTLVKEGAFGTSSLLNTPVQNRIPNRQRAVGNHLGIFAKPADD